MSSIRDYKRKQARAERRERFYDWLHAIAELCMIAVFLLGVFTIIMLFIPTLT